MRARILIIVAAAVLAAAVLVKCSSRGPDFNPNLVSLKEHRDKLTATLTTQLESINYPATVTAEGETLNICVGQASVGEVRRVICRPLGWPGDDDKMVQIDGTLWSLRETGITKVKITVSLRRAGLTMFWECQAGAPKGHNLFTEGRSESLDICSILRLRRYSLR